MVLNAQWFFQSIESNRNVKTKYSISNHDDCSSKNTFCLCCAQIHCNNRSVFHNIENAFTIDIKLNNIQFRQEHYIYWISISITLNTALDLFPISIAFFSLIPLYNSNWIFVCVLMQTLPTFQSSKHFHFL